MDTIVIAGGIPERNDPLFAFSQGRPKAMINIQGQPMICWVLNGLADAKLVDNLIVVGIDSVAEQGEIQQRVKQSLTFLPNKGGLVNNGLAGLEHVYHMHGRHVPVIGCSSDIPHMQGYMVDDLIGRCQPLDRVLYYAVITPETMQSAYPNADRTYANFRGEKLTGCDIFVSNTRILHTNQKLWQAMINARKNPLAMAWQIGFGSLLRLALRRMSLDDAARLAGEKLEDEQPIGLVYSPYAELAMDGDKPHQIEILREPRGMNPAAKQ
ncbi:MAG: NTP transferase domain-containing protein [Chloroflexota bacterium]